MKTGQDSYKIDIFDQLIIAIINQLINKQNVQ